MGKFLNKPAIVEGIKKIISEAQKELIIIVPYIKVSEHVYHLLKEADSRGVEIFLLYREDKLSPSERQKLISLNNLNLLSHADIHAKCYFNEDQMIITSMNLYDYSEKFNREMGVLVDRIGYTYNSGELYRDALDEVRAIIQSARLEKKSITAQGKGYNSILLRPEYERLFSSCKLINKHFNNRRFEVIDNGYKGQIKCKGYYENIDVLIEPDFEKPINEETGDFTFHRAAIDFTWEEEVKKKVNDAFDYRSAEYRFPDFKVYWDWYGKSLTIYRDKRKFPRWEQLTLEQTIEKYSAGIESVALHLKQIEKELRH